MLKPRTTRCLTVKQLPRNRRPRRKMIRPRRRSRKPNLKPPSLLTLRAEPQSESEPQQTRPNRVGFVLASVLAIASFVAVGVPRFRQRLPLLYRNTVHAGRSWLNPPPAALPQAAAQHDSFGQSGDEYKLPVPTNIPDATTDPSQIQVLPVVDPTAKVDKNAAAAAAAAQAAATDNPNIQNPNSPDPSVQVEEKPQPVAAAPDATPNPASTVAPVFAPSNFGVRKSATSGRHAAGRRADPCADSCAHACDAAKRA